MFINLKYNIRLLIATLTIIMVGNKAFNQDTLAFYSFDDGNTSGFTTGFSGLGWFSTGGCSWEIGEPSGGRGYSNLRGQKGFVGNPDPTIDFSLDNTQNYVAGQGLSTDNKKEGISGHFNSSSEWIQAPALNCSNYFNVKLTFWQWGNFESGYDNPFVEVSNDGTNWNVVYSPAILNNTSWEKISLDISNFANDQNQVYIRWRTESDGSIFYAGWNIDNITITGDYSDNDSDSHISIGSILPPESISSLSDSFQERISFAQFTITDNGSGDGLPTKIDTFVIAQNEFNTVPNWKKAIGKISIYDLENTTELIGKIENDRVVFVNPGMFTIQDGASKTYTLRLYLQQDLSNISDNDRLGMTLSFVNFSMNLEGSFIGSGIFSTNENHLRIDIEATQLTFISDPEQLVDVDRVITPFVQVAAIDENGNIDTDFSETIILSNTLGLATSNNNVKAENGIAFFNSFVFTETGGPTVLQAIDQANGLDQVTSQVSITISESVSSNIFEDNFDNSGVTGWTTGAISGSTSWETGEPNGGRGYNNIRGQKGYVGNPDPLNDHSTNEINYVYGQGLSKSSKTEGKSGYYNSSNEWLMSPAINCTDYYNTQLSFWRWTNVEADYDKAYLEISTDAAQWVDLGHEIYPQDQDWTYLTYDISQYADRQETVYIRWRLESDETIFYSGWNIDDITVTGIFSPVTTWIGVYSNNWNDPENWNTNIVPDDLTSVIIEANTPYSAIVSSNIAICKEIRVREMAVLEIAESGRLEVFGNLTIETNVSGYGSLYDKGIITIHGKGIISRHLAAGKWHYVSSPVKNINTSLFGSKIFHYNEPLASADWLNGWELAVNETMEPGKGYDVKSMTDTEVRMEGKFYTGDFDINLTYTDGSEIAEHEGWNLVGNPYPSAIDWDAPSGWTKTNISGAIYIWDKELQNFVTYVGGIGANGGSRYIAPMQGFFVKVLNPGTATLSMTNEVRNNSTSTLLKAAAYKNEIKVKITSEDFSDETVIGLKHGAKLTFDLEYDADKKFSPNSNVPQIYSHGEETNPLAINNLPLNDEYYQVKIFTSVPKEGEYALNIDGVYTFDFSKTIYLEDLVLDTLIDLSYSQEYYFSSETVSDSGRFILHINMPLTITYDVKHVSAGQTNDGTIDLTILGGVQPILEIKWSNGSLVEDIDNLQPGVYTIVVTDYNNNTIRETIVVQQTSSDGSLVSLNNSDENHIIVFESNGYLLVDNPLELSISNTKIFDLSGKLVYSDNNNHTTSYSIPIENLKGLYIVNLYGEGKLSTHKIIINH